MDNKCYGKYEPETIEEFKITLDSLRIGMNQLLRRIDALELLIKTEAPGGLCENFIGCHSNRLDKYCLDCPDFILDETIIDKYKERITNV